MNNQYKKGKHKMKRTKKIIILVSIPTILNACSITSDGLLFGETAHKTLIERKKLEQTKQEISQKSLKEALENL